MSRFDQPDLFDAGQPDLFGATPQPATGRADPDRVRARLRAIIGEARAASALPWSRADLRLYRTIVPQMVRWLPDDEAAQFRLAFDTEVDRLLAA